MQRSNRTLATSPLAWVALACVGGLGLYESIRESPASRTLEYTNKDDLLVVRENGPFFDFPILGARVTLPDRWTYLSTTDPGLAEAPTFVNLSTHAIVRLRSAWGVEWDSGQFEHAQQQIGDVVIDWIKPDVGQHAIVATMLDAEVPIQWSDQPFQRVGRLRRGELALIVVVVSPQDKENKDDSDKSISDLLRQVELGKTD